MCHEILLPMALFRHKANLLQSFMYSSLLMWVANDQGFTIVYATTAFFAAAATHV